MFRMRGQQESLWQSQFLVTPKKAERLKGSWAEVFRNQALPLIDEERFAPMYCDDNGRLNRAVQTVLGVHILKEMFNLTDQEALGQLEFNLLWHHLGAGYGGDPPAPEDAAQLPSSPDAARRWPAGFPGDHGPNYPGPGDRHRQAAAGFHPHHEQHRHPDATQIITHVEVTPSSGSDATVTVPLIDALSERGIPPEELIADTTFGSGRNAFEARRRGTELVSPVAGPAPKGVVEQTGEWLTAADFAIDSTGARATICPAGHSSIDEYEDCDAPEKVEIHFARESCECCPLRWRCPVGCMCSKRTWSRRTSSAGGEPRPVGSSLSGTRCALGSKAPTPS